MRILVDADACPVKNIIIEVAKEYNLDVYMYFDSSHEYNDDYSKVIIVDKSKDSVDINILNNMIKEDIVVTGDYGLASLVLSKKGYAINQNGLIYSNDNIDKLLFDRFLGVKNRKANIKTKNIKKRLKENDINFKNSLIKLISCKTK